jgi:hypothetical protein
VSFLFVCSVSYSGVVDRRGRTTTGMVAGALVANILVARRKGEPAPEIASSGFSEASWSEQGSVWDGGRDDELYLQGTLIDWVDTLA